MDRKAWEIEGRTRSTGPREGLKTGALRPGLGLWWYVLYPGSRPHYMFIWVCRVYVNLSLCLFITYLLNSMLVLNLFKCRVFGPPSLEGRLINHSDSYVSKSWVLNGSVHDLMCCTWTARTSNSRLNLQKDHQPGSYTSLHLLYNLYLRGESEQCCV
jgi:hypothetical protein